MRKFKVFLLLSILPVALLSCEFSLLGTQFKSMLDVYGFSAVSSSVLLKSQPAPNSGTLATGVSQDKIECISKYINVIEYAINTNPIATTDNASDKDSYKKKSAVTIKEPKGKKATFDMYITDQEKIDDDFDESKTSFKGLFLYDSSTSYTFNGETEKEFGSLDVKMKIKENDDNYVDLVIDKTGPNIEFNFTIFKGGSQVEKAEFDVTLVLSKVDINLDIRESNVAGAVWDYKIFYEPKNNAFLVVDDGYKYAVSPNEDVYEWSMLKDDETEETQTTTKRYISYK